MKTVFVLLLFCHAAFAERHSLEMSLITTSGLPDFPEFVATVVIDGFQSGYFDSNMKTGKLSDDLAKEFIKYYPEDLNSFTYECHTLQHIHREKLGEIRRHYGQSEGVHILQRRSGCEWDDETKETVSFQQYGYNGKDLAALDMQRMTWTAPKYETFTLTNKWDSDTYEVEYNKFFYHQKCRAWLKSYVQFRKSFLQRTGRMKQTVLPSVSLLQKSPSSPVSCFATGFYPNRAVMFWRKDGEELFEDVEHGDILPNHDRTFQMSVDLNISLVKTEDWRRYECVFQLSGVKEDMVTKLEEAAIRSNRVPGSGFPSGPVSGVTVGLLLLSVCITGLFIWRRKNNGFQLANKERGALGEEAEL